MKRNDGGCSVGDVNKSRIDEHERRLDLNDTETREIHLLYVATTHMIKSMPDEIYKGVEKLIGDKIKQHDKRIASLEKASWTFAGMFTFLGSILYYFKDKILSLFP